MARSASRVYSQSTRIRKQGKVGKGTLQSRRLLKKVFTLAIVTLILGLISVWSRTDIVETGYRIHKHTGINRQLTAESDSLKLEVATLRSPQRLEKVAREKMKLRKPLERQVIFIK